jgi:hypothetical protein
MKPRIFIVLLILAVAAAGLSKGQNPQHAIRINLTLNSTDSTIFIPGEGSFPAGTPISRKLTSAPHFYLASYFSGRLQGLVFSQENPIHISASSNGTHHFLSLEQNLTPRPSLHSQRGTTKQLKTGCSL